MPISAASVSALLTKEPSQIKLSTLIALCTALQCTPERPFRDRHHPGRGLRGSAATDRNGAAGGQRSGAFDAADVTGNRNGRPIMGKRQRDCVECGAPVGFREREHRCRCMRLRREQSAKARCPGCGSDRVLVAETGRCVPCARGDVVIAAGKSGSAARSYVGRARKRTELAAARSMCPRCGKPGYVRGPPGGADVVRARVRRRILPGSA